MLTQTAEIRPLPAKPRPPGRPVLHLSAEEVEAFGRELDAVRQSVLAELGEEDARYIRRMVKVQRALEAGGRGAMFFSFLPPAWLAGTAALSLSKILDNMEIGHNVMHGQYDWMNDPVLSSKKFEWDAPCPSENWRHSHNYMHHTHTNILGKDRDVGYGLLRMTEEQPWTPLDLLNPVRALALAFMFEWGVALHDLELDRVASGQTRWAEVSPYAKRLVRKALSQAKKDYVVYPLLAFPIAPLVLAGNATANVARSVWSFTIIFCGHFPEGVHVFDEEETRDETRGAWYVRQLLGSANITGGKLFHIMSGNLSHQIEHHLFPDLPAWRYAQMAPQVRAICERYGLPYNTGSLSKQFGSVVRKIFRLALP
jgi:NADPH-dependent stearoyl-CoA 9-desaturase